MNKHHHLAEEENFSYGLRRRDLDQLMDTYSRHDLNRLQEACVSILPPGSMTGSDPALILNTGFTLSQIRGDIVRIDLRREHLPVSLYRNLEKLTLNSSDRNTLERLIPNVRERAKAFHQHLVTRKFQPRGLNEHQVGIVRRMFNAMAAVVVSLTNRTLAAQPIFDRLIANCEKAEIPITSCLKAKPAPQATQEAAEDYNEGGMSV
jgi:hypothetical protein